LTQKQSGVVKAPRDPSFNAISKALAVKTIGGVADNTLASYKQQYSILLSTVRQDEYNEMYNKIKDLPAFVAVADDKTTQLFALAYIYYYWDQLSINNFDGKYQIGTKYGPLRFDTQKMDDLIENGKITVGEISSNETENTTSSDNLEPTIAEKREILEERSFEYGLIYLKDLIDKCTLSGEIDAACVFGKYTCADTFQWGNLNSCGQNYDACEACQSIIVPKMYTYLKDIACKESDDTCWGKTS